MGEILGFAWRGTVALSTLKTSGLVLNEVKFTSRKWLFFCIVWISWADLGQFSLVFVHLLCLPRNYFQDTSVRNANQINSPWATRIKFTPAILITPKFRVHQRRWYYFALVFLTSGSCTMKRNWQPPIPAGKVCWEPLDEALFGYRGIQTIRAFKLWFKLLTLGVGDCWLFLMTLHITVKWMSLQLKVNYF